MTRDNPHIAIDAKTGRRILPGTHQRRIRGEPSVDSHTHHVMSRFVKEVPFMDDVEREGLRKLIWKMAEFMGIDVMTYCVMGNHFHALIKVPNRERWLEKFSGTDGEIRLFKHLSTFYSNDFIADLRREIEGLRRRGQESAVQAKLDEFRVRFCGMSVFVKELKQRFTKWLNKRRGRRGTVWMDRFLSKLIVGPKQGLITAAYIDLNPVRAGIVSDPKDYRWCGYAEALAGDKRAQTGICQVLHAKDWMKASQAQSYSGRAAYRMVLYDSGGRRLSLDGVCKRLGFAPDESEKVLRGQVGELSANELAMQRWRHRRSDSIKCSG
jgi:putative transposase